MTTTQKITPCLWFNFNAEEAVNYYLSIFKNSKILEISHYGDAVPEPTKVKCLLYSLKLKGRSFKHSMVGHNSHSLRLFLSV